MHRVTAAEIGVFDVLKIGIGPSSSHTLGPLLAARRFREVLARLPVESGVHLRVSLFGSLAATGRGHRTAEAICAGLLDCDPSESAIEAIWGAMSQIASAQGFCVGGVQVAFRPERDIAWELTPAEPLVHPNTLRFVAELECAPPLVLTARSVGGGFVEYDDATDAVVAPVGPAAIPYPFDSADKLVRLCEAGQISIAEVARANEAGRGMGEPELRARLARLWAVTNEAIERGLHTEGVLPGGLDVRRRAPQLFRQCSAINVTSGLRADLLASAYAMAVSEENAAGGRVVTAPTNGAAGVLPAVLRLLAEEQALALPAIEDGLLVAATLGAIIKRAASISGAEVGCQGEIGTSAAMAAAAAVHVLGGSARQAEAAAEMAIEHHLGMTCDPVRGLVQIPCIERNAMGAVKALNAAAMALASDGTHQVSLDRALRVMKQTGLDMQAKYKETATGGLAVG
ncbi:MAG: L-serine ammonia-lyase [Phycisphaerae bacterium]|nr:L-serine ammonia-lyase [Phycisphaerae bacterium]